ncbi:PREDICTED: protein NLRC3-like [Cyprinodon variegatus]|uniref:Protein NLRC3-like n=1 Tax=Cyprinodon variegatus TaxID=28743 RepID=A0A3Q2D056_CYPVA|nr:PREDICTED: protein NLRC3-like [Cyprinodon variegatus]
MDDSIMLSDDSSIGDAVSGRGDGEEFIDEEDLYYIPERRPSLDLEETPMDTSNWHYVEQALSPAQSYKSLTSDDPEEKEDMEGSSTRVQLERADSFSSCYSVDSNDCEKIIPRERSKDETKESSNKLELIQEPEEIKHPSLTLKFTFTALCDTLKQLQVDFSIFKWKLWTYYPQPFSGSQSMDLVDLVDRLLETFTCEMSIQITRTILVSLDNNYLSDYLKTLCIKNQVRYELAGALQRKFCDEPIMEGETMPMDDLYTDFLIVGDTDNGPNIEHEVLNIPQLNTKKKPDPPVPFAETLSKKKSRRTGARMVFLQGVAGSGKSVFVKKLVRDWSLERSHQQFLFVFPLTFRELKEYDEGQVSLRDIIEKLYPETVKLRENKLKLEDEKALFIFDGLDEYDTDFNFNETEIHSDPTDPISLHINVVNMLRGRLINRSWCLITTRPQVYPYAPWDGHYDRLELRGFSDANKEEYFHKRFKDPNQAARVIEYVKSLKTLHIMCYLPMFCKMVADECQRIFREKGAAAELPRSITYMYTKLLLKLIYQLRKERRKAPNRSKEEEEAFLLEMGKQAFTMLEKGKFSVLRRNWPQGTSLEAVVFSGICEQFTTTPQVLFDEDVVSFLHPTMQEYLAALYAFLSYTNHEKNIFSNGVKSLFSKGGKIMDVYKAAVEKSLQCEDGHLDLFLRFLFGMASKTNQELLQPLLKPSAKLGDLSKDCASVIKKAKETPYPDRKTNLQRCLEESGFKL